MNPRFDQFTGALLASAAATAAMSIPALRDDEEYCIDDSAYEGRQSLDDMECFSTPEALQTRLAEIANERDLGTGDNSCHDERPTVFIKRRANINFRVQHSIVFD